MDSLDAARGQLRSFKKNDFETDWTKVAEGKFGQIYQVKIKLWREICALKVFDKTVGPNRWVAQYNYYAAKRQSEYTFLYFIHVCFSSMLSLKTVVLLQEPNEGCVQLSQSEIQVPRVGLWTVQ